jgi:siroheme decarboxylase
LPRVLSAEEKKIIRMIQGDLPLAPAPFAGLAKKAGIEEKEFLKKVRGFMRRGLIRRFGAILRHQIAGYRGNAMAVWRVPEAETIRIARKLAAFPAVSHCYLRPEHPGWPYNIYTMIHGKNRRDCRATAEKMARATGISRYRLLFSEREHKKSSMNYFG